MSNINPKELQKFYDLWAPVLAVLSILVQVPGPQISPYNYLTRE